MSKPEENEPDMWNFSFAPQSLAWVSKRATASGVIVSAMILDSLGNTSLRLRKEKSSLANVLLEHSCLREAVRGTGSQWQKDTTPQPNPCVFRDKAQGSGDGSRQRRNKLENV